MSHIGKKMSEETKRKISAKDIQTPAIMDITATTWAMKPFLKPCIRAGMKHIKRMISKILIIQPKFVYLQIRIQYFAKLDKYFKIL